MKRRNFVRTTCIGFVGAIAGCNGPDTESTPTDGTETPTEVATTASVTTDLQTETHTETPTASSTETPTETQTEAGTERPSYPLRQLTEEQKRKLDSGQTYDGSFADRRGSGTVAVAVGQTPSNALFEPPAIWINPGQTVHWEWRDGEHEITHTNGDAFTEKTPTPTQTLTGTATATPGGSISHTFDERGVYMYKCTNHASVGAYGVVVVGGPQTTATAEN